VFVDADGNEGFVDEYGAVVAVEPDDMAASAALGAASFDN
jgi:hypothetical protein